MCSKCGGSGWIPAYAHIEDGRCFECNPLGLRYNEHRPYRLEHSATLSEPCPYWRVVTGWDEESAHLVRFHATRKAAWQNVKEATKWQGLFIKVIAPEGMTLRNGKSTWSITA